MATFGCMGHGEDEKTVVARLGPWGLVGWLF